MAETWSAVHCASLRILLKRMRLADLQRDRTMTHSKTDHSTESHAETLRRNRELFDRCNRKFGGPAPALTPEERDRSEMELHNHRRRHASHSSSK